MTEPTNGCLVFIITEIFALIFVEIIFHSITLSVCSGYVERSLVELTFSLKSLSDNNIATFAIIITLLS